MARTWMAAELQGNLQYGSKDGHFEKNLEEVVFKQWATGNRSVLGALPSSQVSLLSLNASRIWGKVCFL